MNNCFYVLFTYDFKTQYRFEMSLIEKRYKTQKDIFRYLYYCTIDCNQMFKYYKNFISKKFPMLPETEQKTSKKSSNC